MGHFLCLPIEAGAAGDQRISRRPSETSLRKTIHIKSEPAKLAADVDGLLVYRPLRRLANFLTVYFRRYKSAGLLNVASSGFFNADKIFSATFAVSFSPQKGSFTS